MGRAVGFLGELLALARLAVEARGIWRDWRADAEQARPDAPAPEPGPDVAVGPAVAGGAGGPAATPAELTSP